MMRASPHHAVREDWLALAEPEHVIAPEQPILDAHHHLWDRPEGRYIAQDFARDLADGHDVRASLYVQCRTGYRQDGPEALAPVGEVETIRQWCAKTPQYPIGIVAFADLQLGDEVTAVLDALIDAGQGVVRGIRNATAFHPDPVVRSNPRPAVDGLLRSDAFVKGARVLAERGLCLDVWAYQTQLEEVFAVARALPQLTVVIDHCGGPLGVGPHRLDSPENFKNWRDSLARLASLPNTQIKIGGFGLSVMGFDYATQPLPPHSQRLASDWRPYFETCLELFGSNRAMFESNFPVDKGQFGYRTAWNAFKRLSANLDAASRDDLFWRSAAQCYGIDPETFTQPKTSQNHTGDH
jgi:L-fuconolactonase